jgi:hypothetical protein
MIVRNSSPAPQHRHAAGATATFDVGALDTHLLFSSFLDVGNVRNMPESSSDNFENLRRQAIESALWIPEDASDDLKRAKARSSLYRFLLNEITKSAKQEAVAGGRTNFSLSMTFLPKPSRSLPIFNGLLSVSQTLPILARIGISGSTNKTHFIASKRRTSHILIDQVLSQLQLDILTHHYDALRLIVC